MSGCIIYVGGLPGDVKQAEVEEIFDRYGRIARVSVKPGLERGQNAFSFVEFSDPRDASDAVRSMDGREALGKRLRVELSRGGRGRDDGGRGGYRDERGGGRGGAGGFARPYNTSYRVVVKGLPPSASWQDLKDHMRKGGEVTFAQVVRDGSGAMGLVDYASSEDMRTAISKLDDTEFRSTQSSDSGYITVREDRGERDGGGRDDRRGGRDDRRDDRSRSHSRGRRDDRSPARRASRSPERERSPARAASRSPVRERSERRERERSPVREDRGRERERSRSPRRRTRSRS